MSTIDIVLGILLIYGLYKGLKNGLFVELASLLAFFIGLFIAIKFSYTMVDLFPPAWPTKTIKIASFLITLLLVIIAIYQLATVFSKIASFAYLGWLNKLGGAFFATLKSILIIGVLLGLIEKINFNNLLISKKTQDDSLFYNPILKTSATLLPILTDWYTDLSTKISADLKK